MNLYSWLDGKELQQTILKSLNLETHFQVEKFPAVRLGRLQQKRVAIYNIPSHQIVFNHKHIGLFVTTLTHTYFHELMHSTVAQTNRWERYWANVGLWRESDVIGLEERIADISAHVLCHVFDNDFAFHKEDELYSTTRQYFTSNPTVFDLPWDEVEFAVLCLLKNKNCQKVRNTLNYYKRFIQENEFTTIKEGFFNG